MRRLTFASLALLALSAFLPSAYAQDGGGDDPVPVEKTEVPAETEVRVHDIEFDDPWDLEQVYSALHDFAREYPFDTESEDYLLHITTGTHVVQICFFLLAESKHFPAKLVQSSPPRRGSPTRA